jgi:RNA-directed DNA polymerase
VKDRTVEQQPSAVPEKAQQGGDIRARWAWVEPAVWTERRLATLETGIEGGKWFRLIDKVWSPRNLAGSLQKVVAKGGSAGIDNQSVRVVQAHQEQTIQKLEQELRAGQYRPQAVKRVWIPKPGKPRETAAGSSDGQSYFDTIPHERLMEQVAEKIADGKVLSLIEGMLRAGMMDSVKGWQESGQGSPQGAVISPLLSNIYLNGLDWKMARSGYEMVRYADDFVVLCSKQEEAQQALEQISQWVEENGLKLHPTKTRLVDASQRGGFDFLGYRFERGRKWPRKKSLSKLKDAIRSKTRRSDGRSMRRRSKRKGRAKGRDNSRWPNTYFTTAGLFSLKQAHAAACRSS